MITTLYFIQWVDFYLWQLTAPKRQSVGGLLTYTVANKLQARLTGFALIVVAGISFALQWGLILGCIVINSGVMIWLVTRDNTSIPERERAFNFWTAFTQNAYDLLFIDVLFLSLSMIELVLWKMAQKKPVPLNSAPYKIASSSTRQCLIA